MNSLKKGTIHVSVICTLFYRSSKDEFTAVKAHLYRLNGPAADDDIGETSAQRP
jgi:hypothetical protein